MTDTTLVHHSSWPLLDHAVAPESPVTTATDWRTVTCPECRLERPEDFTGRPEYHVPKDVLARASSLAEGDRVRRLARAEERMLRAHKEFNEAFEAYKAWLHPLSKPQSEEKRLGVPVSTLAATEALAGLSEGARYWLRQGPYVGSPLPRPIALELQGAGLLGGEGLTDLGKEVRKLLFEIS